ncbi:exodeoxyribonuclease III [bacterium I07]|nr:exodeoxyribonuclease III [bacterium I07]
MNPVRIISWNVNGIRAINKKGFMDWFNREMPDVLCLQETKAHEEQLPEELRHIDNYHIHYESAQRKGYSGVAVFSKQKPLSVHHGLDINEFDLEGRTLIVEYDKFFLYNVYFPNGKASPERLAYKMAFYDQFLKHALEMSSNEKGIVICGDVNTAHQEIDLARPKENEKSSGFLPQERAWIDRLLSNGFLDTLRVFKSDPGLYTWWDYKTRARDRNVGWRIDYFFVSKDLNQALKNAFIMTDVMGSDHCPIGIELQF